MTHYSLPSLLLCSARREVLYPRWIRGRKIVGKVKFWDFQKVSRLKHEFQARNVIMVIMVNYIPRFNFVYKLQCFQVVPAQGIMTTNFAPNWNFVKPREG